MSGEVVIRLGAAEDIARLRPLWEALYVDQQQKGMVLTVPPGAFDAWAAALTPVVNRFGCVALAESSAGLHGFVAGRSRPIPPYFGGGMAGFVSDVFVEVAYRGQGIARAMIDRAAAFFASTGARRLELQVVPGNDEAIAAYERMGWTRELLQMSRPLIIDPSRE